MARKNPKIYSQTQPSLFPGKKGRPKFSTPHLPTSAISEDDLKEMVPSDFTPGDWAELGPEIREAVIRNAPEDPALPKLYGAKSFSLDAFDPEEFLAMPQHLRELVIEKNHDRIEHLIDVMRKTAAAEQEWLVKYETDENEDGFGHALEHTVEPAIEESHGEVVDLAMKEATEAAAENTAVATSLYGHQNDKYDSDLADFLKDMLEEGADPTELESTAKELLSQIDYWDASYREGGYTSHGLLGGSWSGEPEADDIELSEGDDHARALIPKEEKATEMEQFVIAGIIMGVFPWDDRLPDEFEWDETRERQWDAKRGRYADTPTSETFLFNHWGSMKFKVSAYYEGYIGATISDKFYDEMKERVETGKPKAPPVPAKDHWTVNDAIYVVPDDIVKNPDNRGYYFVEITQQKELDLIANKDKKFKGIKSVCIADPRMGYVRMLKTGDIRVFALMKHSNTPLLVLHQRVKAGNEPDGQKYAAGAVPQTKGSGNRLPGFESAGADKPTRMEEVRMVVDFLENYLHIDPRDPKMAPELQPALVYLPRANPYFGTPTAAQRKMADKVLARQFDGHHCGYCK